MQIKLCFNDPAATPQIAQYGALYAGSQPCGLITTFQLHIDQIAAMQGINQHRRFFKLCLLWPCWSRFQFMMHTVGMDRNGVCDFGTELRTW